MPRDTGIANRLRAAGLRVVECSGWTTRGSSDFNPRGSVNHHTAGPPTGSTPSLGVCINGRPDLAGPLCAVMQSREPDGNDIAYVVAAGRANHAGSGGWRGLSGNSSVWGLEIEHTGVDPLPAGRQEIAAAIHAALLGGISADYCCQHREWAEGRKIDAAENVDANYFRQLVARGGGGGEEDELNDAQAKSLNRIEVMLEELLYGWRENEGDSKIPPSGPANRLRELVVGLRDESGVPIPNARIGKRIERIDQNVTYMTNDAGVPDEEESERQ